MSSTDNNSKSGVDDDKLVEVDSYNYNVSLKIINKIKERKKEQNRIRSQRYRDKKKQSKMNDDSKVDKNTRSKQRKKDRNLRYRRKRSLKRLMSKIGEDVACSEETEKQQNSRFENKKEASTLSNSQRIDDPLSIATFENQNTYNSQIAGPSTRDVPYVPPTNTADLTTGYEPYISDSESDYYDETHEDIPNHPSYNHNTLSHDVQTITSRMHPYYNLSGDKYSSFDQDVFAHQLFKKNFIDNDFGHVCDICNRLWFKSDLKIVMNNDRTSNIQFIRTMLEDVNIKEVKICSTCLLAIRKNCIPTLSVYNGFKYLPFPEYLKNSPLDLVTERLISPRIPFMQIRRLRHVHGQSKIYGQVINVPIEVDTMVRSLPRNMDDDHTITVHIKRRKIHKSNYIYGIVDKRRIKAWLRYLKDTPLYISNRITVDDNFFDSQNYVQPETIFDEDGDNDSSEHIPIDESLIAQQQTLMWNDKMYLRTASGGNNVPVNLLFDSHTEELSFPQIYLGHPRTFRDGASVTPFMMATSELRRADRRGVTPQHLLYLAMKIMRIRIRDSLSIASKHIGKDTVITKKQIQSEDYMQGCIESNLAFLRTIPNSVNYWLEKKKDLFAMIRQYGKPTVFFTISANEIGWPKLLQLLYKLKNESEISLEDAAALNFMEKSTLINEDAVTCAIYFNKLVNVLLKILQSKRNQSPFKKYKILHYFERIEFQHQGSPQAHIFAWLDNAPEDALGKDYHKAIDLIDSLISVSAAEASGDIKLQTHKHTFTCYKGIASRTMQKCRFEAPFMPIKKTVILTPMKETEIGFIQYKAKYNAIRKNLESYEYNDFQTFYRNNNINSDEEYINTIRAGINRPRVFPKREPYEKWNNPFNPFILNIVQSNMDFQFITEEYSCAAYVVEYVNKTSRDVSNLQKKIVEVMDEHPEFDIFDITKNISINLLNHVEISSQEAAWYLLKESMSRSSIAIVYIPTVWPVERQRIKKTLIELGELDDDCMDIWKEDWFDKYEKRPEDLENISLAQFVSKYYKKNNGEYAVRSEPKVIRYRNYDMTSNYNEYQREMVTLHIPFRNEEAEIIAEMKFIKLYDENEDLILQKRREFESNIDIDKTLRICREMCREMDPDDNEEIRDVISRLPDENPFQELYNLPNTEMTGDLKLAMLSKLEAIANKKDNIMSYDAFYNLVRQANEEQREILFHTMHHLMSVYDSMHEPLFVYLIGPAGSGKTFVIKGIMEIYNGFSETDGISNAYIVCASTGKAATAMSASTIPNALNMSLSKLIALDFEKASQYRTLFKFVKVVIIDEVGMVSSELLEQIDTRLKQITGCFTRDFGGLDIILIGDLRHLPPVKATPVSEQTERRMISNTLLKKFKKFELKKAMRQKNNRFSRILTKIGDGYILTEEEIQMIESRFIPQEEAQSLCPEGIRLLLTDAAVDKYNNSILNSVKYKTVFLASDVLVGCHYAEQENCFRQKLLKMRTDETGGLPHKLILALNHPYMITNNIDVTDELSNGTVGRLYYVERNENGEIIRIWMKFPKYVGRKQAMKFRNLSANLNLDNDAVPIAPQIVFIPLNNNKTIIAKRKQFPFISALAVSIHKSQGGTYNSIVYEYDQAHSRELVYVALTRVRKIENLFLVTKQNTRDSWKFCTGRIGTSLDVSVAKHRKRSTSSREDLMLELQRIDNNTLQTVTQTFLEFISNRNDISIFSFNCQNLLAHAIDLGNDSIVKKSNVLLLSETRMTNDHPIDIPNFNFIVSYKRPELPVPRIAVYHNRHDSSRVITSNMDIHTKFTESISVNASKIGEICVARCNSENGRSILMVAVYISPGASLRQIKQLLLENLLIYTKEGSAILERSFGVKFDDIPMILSGDFNIDFSKDDNLPLIEYLNERFGLTMSHDRKLNTTKYKTKLDVVFVRYLDKFQSNLFVSYFSYHKPDVPSLEYDEINERRNNLRIVEINEDHTNNENDGDRNQANSDS